MGSRSGRHDEVINITAQDNTRAMQASIDRLEAVGDALDEIGQEGKEAESGVKGAGNGLSKMADATVVAFGAVTAFKTGLEGLSAIGAFLSGPQEQMGLLQVQTGLTGDALKDLYDSAQSVYLDGYGDSLDGVLETMKQVATLTDLKGIDAEKLAQDAELIESAFGEDTQGTIRAANTMMKVFGITSQHATDLLLTGLQETGDPADDLYDSIIEYGPAFAKMGFSSQQMLGLMNKGLALGIRNTDDVADGIREFGIKLDDGTAKAGFMALGLTKVYTAYQNGEITAQAAFDAATEGLRGVTNESKRAQIGAQLFGTKYEDTKGVFAELDTEASAAFENIEGATDEAGAAFQDNLGAKIENTKRSFSQLTKLLAQPIATAALDEIGPLLEEGADAWQMVIDNWDLAPIAFELVLEKIKLKVADGVNGILQSFQPILDAPAGLFELAGFDASGLQIPDLIDTSGIRDNIDALYAEARDLRSSDEIKAFAEFLQNPFGGLEGSGGVGMGPAPRPDTITNAMNAFMDNLDAAQERISNLDFAKVGEFMMPDYSGIQANSGALGAEFDRQMTIQMALDTGEFDPTFFQQFFTAEEQRFLQLALDQGFLDDLVASEETLNSLVEMDGSVDLSLVDPEIATKLKTDFDSATQDRTMRVTVDVEVRGADGNQAAIEQGQTSAGNAVQGGFQGVQHLGDYARGGAFSMGSFGGGDRLFSIGLSGDEDVNITPRNQAGAPQVLQAEITLMLDSNQVLGAFNKTLRMKNAS